jgi:hypothetical protein
MYLDEGVFVEEVFCGDFEGDVALSCFWIEASFSGSLGSVYVNRL